MKETLNDLLNWMDENFNGDLDELQTKAFNKTKEDKIVLKLWEEIGEQVLRYMYRDYRIKPMRNKIIKSKNYHYKNEIKEENILKENQNKKVAVYNNRVKTYFVNGRYYDLMNMTKDDCLEVASYHNKLAKSNAFERDFLNEIASNLKNGQIVKDVFTIDEIRNLRTKEKKLKVV